MILFGRNNWGDKGSAGTLQIHWRMWRLDGNDGVMVPQLTGQCFVSLVAAMCSKTRNVLKNSENQPPELFPKTLYEIVFSEGSLFVEAVLGRQQWFSSGCSYPFPGRGDIPGQELSSSVFTTKLCHRRGWGGPVARLGQSGLLAQLLIPKWALGTVMLPWMSGGGGGSWGLSWSLLTVRSSGGNCGLRGALELSVPSALSF